MTGSLNDEPEYQRLVREVARDIKLTGTISKERFLAQTQQAVMKANPAFWEGRAWRECSRTTC
jgi:hypothetical protein